jgi:hypothetical protein
VDGERKQRTALRIAPINLNQSKSNHLAIYLSQEMILAIPRIQSYSAEPG